MRPLAEKLLEIGRLPTDMSQNDIQFSDGEAYERSMGIWSRLAGEAFLPFVNAPPAARWLDVGCGNGAFTELILDHCEPRSVDGIDPSQGQIAFARTRLDPQRCRLQVASADALPFADETFDVVTMALVLFFVPDPAKAVSEMARVARRGGLVTAYSWDMLNVGFPFDNFQSALRDMKIEPTMPPSSYASQMLSKRGLWREAELTDIRTSVIEVQRVYESFDDLWTSSTLVASIRPLIAILSDEKVVELKDRLRVRGSCDTQGRVTCQARANAIVGRKV